MSDERIIVHVFCRNNEAWEKLQLFCNTDENLYIDFNQSYLSWSGDSEEYIYKSQSPLELIRR